MLSVLSYSNNKEKDQWLCIVPVFIASGCYQEALLEKKVSLQVHHRWRFYLCLHNSYIPDAVKFAQSSDFWSNCSLTCWDFVLNTCNMALVYQLILNLFCGKSLRCWVSLRWVGFNFCWTTNCLNFSSVYMNYFCYKATDMCTIVILLKYVAVVNIRV